VENNFLAAGLLVQDQIFECLLLRILHLFNVYDDGCISDLIKQTSVKSTYVIYQYKSLVKGLFKSNVIGLALYGVMGWLLCRHHTTDVLRFFDGDSE
jgi:hypothetical protein